MSDVVLFSGGCDSTLVLYRRAMEALKTNSYNKVKALSITHDQIPAQPWFMVVPEQYEWGIQISSGKVIKIESWWK